jgi:Notch-like protein
MSTESIAITIASIINNAFLTNTFPDEMKKCVVTPLYKKKDHMCKENYRPISIISVFSKVFEMLISEQITVHMNSYFDKN